MFTNAKIINALTGQWAILTTPTIILTIVLLGLVFNMSPNRLVLVLALIPIVSLLVGMLISQLLVSTNLKGYCRYQNAIATFKNFPMMIIVVSDEVDNGSQERFCSLARVIHSILRRHGIKMSQRDYWPTNNLAQVQGILNKSECKCALVITILTTQQINFALLGQTEDSLWETTGYNFVPNMYCDDIETRSAQIGQFIVETTLEQANSCILLQSSGRSKYYDPPKISLTGKVFETENPNKILLCVEQHGESHIGGEIESYAWDFDGDGKTDRTTTKPSIELEYPFEQGENSTVVTVTTVAGASTKASLSQITTVAKVLVVKVP